MSLLEIKGLTKRFGGLVAVDKLDMVLEEGEIRGLIGPNGSGKTTTFNVIYGTLAPSGGSVTYKGMDITGKLPNIVAGYGITRTFQQISLFRTMSVVDTVMVGAHLRKNCGICSALFNTRKFCQQEIELRKRAMEALEIVGLAGQANRIATELAYGQQRLVEVARALAVSPKLLLLDEPVAGMNPSEIEEMRKLIRKFRDLGITILLVEHNMDLVMDICDRLTVLSHGKKIAEGIPSEVQDNPVVIENYLGRGIEVGIA